MDEICVACENNIFLKQRKKKHHPQKKLKIIFNIISLCNASSNNNFTQQICLQCVCISMLRTTDLPHSISPHSVMGKLLIVL